MQGCLWDSIRVTCSKSRPGCGNSSRLKDSLSITWGKYPVLENIGRACWIWPKTHAVQHLVLTEANQMTIGSSQTESECKRVLPTCDSQQLVLYSEANCSQQWKKNIAIRLPQMPLPHNVSYHLLFKEPTSLRLMIWLDLHVLQNLQLGMEFPVAKKEPAHIKLTCEEAWMNWQKLEAGAMFRIGTPEKGLQNKYVQGT